MAAAVRFLLPVRGPSSMKWKSAGCFVVGMRQETFQVFSLHLSSITGNTKVDQSLQKVTGGKIMYWLQTYEDFVGLTEVKEAQSNVIQAEQRFLDVQDNRRNKQHALQAVQAQLKTIGVELEKVNRGDDRYLSLLTEEHQVLKQEGCLLQEITLLEKSERDYFASLSAAVRESHEKERTRTERTKYWSIIGSVVGAVIGITGTTLNNYLRMRELRGMIKESTAGSGEVRSLVTGLSDTISRQQDNLANCVIDLKSLLGLSGANENASNSSVSEQMGHPRQDVSSESRTHDVQVQTKNALELINSRNQELMKEMIAIKNVIAAGTQPTDNVVYVGPQVETLLNEQERNLEWKMKINSLVTVTMVYGVLAVSLPIIYHLFKGT